MFNERRFLYAKNVGFLKKSIYPDGVKVLNPQPIAGDSLDKNNTAVDNKIMPQNIELCIWLIVHTVNIKEETSSSNYEKGTYN